MGKKREHYTFDFVEVIAFLFKWKKHLLIITLVAAVIAAIVSSPVFITPKFKSVALFYPGTTNSISSSLFYTIKEKAQDPLMFGDEEVDEQFMQLLESGTLKSKVMSRFNLMEHYRIDPNRTDKYTALNKKYDENVKVRRTSYNSIEVAVLDEDPKMAADIANGVMAYVDSVKKEVQGRAALQIFQIVEKQFRNKEAHIQDIKDRLKSLGMRGVLLGIKGVYNSPQGRSVGGQSEGIPKSDISESGAEYVALEEELNFEVEQLSILRLKYEQAKVDIEANLSNIFVIGYAMPAEGKAYPVRSLIVAVSALSAFAMGCVVLALLEKYNQFRSTLLS